MGSRGQVDETTPMVPLGDPGPSYVLHGQRPQFRERREKHFHCCVCTGIISAILIFLILGIIVCYSLWDSHTIIYDSNNSTSNDTQNFNISDDMQLPFQFFAVFPLPDENETNWTMTEPTESELTEAIEAGKEALGDREILEELLVTPAVNSPTFRHQKTVRTTREGRIASKRGYVEDHATRHLAKKFRHKRSYGKRSDIGRGPPSNLEGAKVEMECEDILPKYRSNDGICNNRKNPHWGTSNIPFRRALNPDYCDGISQPRCALDGSLLPSAREISMTVHRPSYYTDPNFTVMLAVWGQFLDHDITATAGTSGENGEPIECCNVPNIHPECFIVPLGKGDPYFDDYNVTCMNFIRSAPAPTNRLGPREQLNQATAFIDGSVVYGATDEKVKSLRSFKDGQLEMFLTPDNRTLLPVSRDPRDGCNEAEENAKGKYCFTSGDERANENLHLTSMHLLWARHHNYLATELKKVNPNWDDEKLFQESRRILAAQMQHITYNEFLSVIIGKHGSESFGLLSTPGGSKSDTYDDELNPSVANEFAASAFRFAHTLLPGLMKVTKELNDSVESIALHNMLFNPYSLYGPNGFDSAIRSAINNSVEKSDSYFTTELTEKLFAKDASPVICGLDLVSLNIQRGRDHGLPSYPDWRRHCRLPNVKTWDEMEKAFDPQSFSTIRKIYKDPNDVDIYTGGLAEYPVKGGIIGPLLTCLIGDQFLRLKKGDSFWYERTRGPQKFTQEQLDEIFETTLSMVICRSSDNVQYSQKYVMKKVSKTNPLESCADLDKFSFEPWREKSYKPASVNVDDWDKINSRSIKV